MNDAALMYAEAMHKLDLMTAERDALRSQLQQARGWMRHTPDCIDNAQSSEIPMENPCICGLADFRAALSADKQGERPLRGQMLDTRIWDRVLSPEEIAALNRGEDVPP